MPPILEDLFEQERLVRPSDSHPNLIHLSRAIASRAGVPDIDHAPATRDLLDRIPSADHLVFILLDGLGMNIVRHLPPESFIASHLRTPIRSTCPSTTACALTSATTAQYPNRHGVAGWFTHLPEFGLTAMILPFAERMTNEPLTRRGIKPENVIPVPPVSPRMTYRAMTIVPAHLANTIYNTYTRGGTAGIGYTSIANAIDQIISIVSTAREPTYTHLYLPEIDTLCHHVGVESPKVLPLVLAIDEQLKRLEAACRSPGSTSAASVGIIVSADHGLIDVPKENQTILLAGDPLLDSLVVPPTGDARMPIFHVREGKHDAFQQQFHERFDKDFVLLSIDDAQRLELFGPGDFSPIARPRFGDFLAIPFNPATLSYHPPHKPRGELYVAVHAGLSPQEMWVPLSIS